MRTKLVIELLFIDDSNCFIDKNAYEIIGNRVYYHEARTVVYLSMDIQCPYLYFPPSEPFLSNFSYQ